MGSSLRGDLQGVFPMMRLLPSEGVLRPRGGGCQGDDRRAGTSPATGLAVRRGLKGGWTGAVPWVEGAFGSVFREAP